METRDNNKLIAEFMGFEFIQSKSKYDIDKDFYLNDVIVLTYQFSRSWDWLMPVIEKIETLNNNGFDFDLYTDGVIITRYRLTLNSELAEGVEIIKNTRSEIGFENKLQLAYISIIEFIKWRNENNK